MGIDTVPAKSISSSLLDSSMESSKSALLHANIGLCFEGSKPTGSGFVITNDEAQSLLRSDSSYRDVVRRYLSGQDLNSSPDQSPSRWIIYFGDMALDEAERYPMALDLVRERVLPGRQHSSRKRIRQLWWQFEHPATRLYESISQFRRVLVMARVSKSLTPVLIDIGPIFSDMIIVFKYDDLNHYGLFASCFHWLWADRWSSTLRLDPRYNPSDSFETFPHPISFDGIEKTAGELWDSSRQAMQTLNEGITALFNRIHSPIEKTNHVERWRQAHVNLNEAVARAYGWDDLNLSHDFVSARQGIRFTVPGAVREEILGRLLDLNNTRYAEEVAAGLHSKRKSVKTRGGPNQSTHPASPALGLEERE